MVFHDTIKLTGVCIKMKSTTITGYNSNYCTPQINKKPAFNGMTKCLKKKIYIDGQKDIAELVAKRPNTYKAVGQLPEFFFKHLPKDNIRGAVREIMEAFDEVALAIRGHYPPDGMFIFDQSKRHRPESVNKILTDVLRKYNILTRWDDDINVKYLDQGGKGKVFKLENLRDPYTEDEYVIKVFHQVTAENWHPFKSHGCYAETNSGMYWREHEGFDTHRGKFFFANLDSGHIVSKYLDEDLRLPERTVPEYKYGIRCTDEEVKKDGSGNIIGYNCIKGYYYDYGGLRVVNRLKNGNRIARRVLERYSKMSDKTDYEKLKTWNKDLANPNNDVNTKAGLALAIKHLRKRSEPIDKCIALNEPLVNQALAYVLKYLRPENGLKYFEKLMQTNDEVTQIILMNEIPLLSKRRVPDIVIEDDINYALKEIKPERVYEYYKIAEKYALPSTIEHLASFVALLPKEKFKESYSALAGLKNSAVHDRMIHKFHKIAKNNHIFALTEIASNITNPDLRNHFISSCTTLPKEITEELIAILDKSLAENAKK